LNTRDQRLAEKAFQNRPACSRVRCIASFALSSSKPRGVPKPKHIRDILHEDEPAERSTHPHNYLASIRLWQPNKCVARDASRE
jgi:hypothetical protein